MTVLKYHTQLILTPRISKKLKNKKFDKLTGAHYEQKRLENIARVYCRDMVHFATTII